MAIYKGAAFTWNEVSAGNRRSWSVAIDSAIAANALADHSVWEKDATTSITLVYTELIEGVVPGATETLTIQLRDSTTNTVVDTVSITNPLTGGTTTLNPTTDGTASGTPLVGDYRIYVRMLRTTVVGHDFNSDTQSTSGYLRLNPTTLTYARTNSGGTPGAYGDTATHTVTLSHGPFATSNNRRFAIAEKKADLTATYKSGNTTSQTGTTPQTGTFTIDNAFPAAVTSVKGEIVVSTGALVPDSDTTLGWIKVPAATSGFVDSKTVRTPAYNVDPRITIDHHLQLNTLTEFAADKTTRLTSDLGFTDARLLNAEGVGLNGITFTETLADAGALVAAKTRSGVVTETRASQAGWGRKAADPTPTFLVWDEPLPGGTWTHTVTITAPAGATGLGTPAVANYTLLAASPSLRVLIGAGPAIANRQGHFAGQPGEQLQVFVGVIDVAEADVLSSTTTPAVTSVGIVLARVNTVGVLQYLDGTFTWVTLVPGTPLTFHACAETAAGSGAWLATFTADATWGQSDIGIAASAVVNGTSYGGTFKESVFGTRYNHQFETTMGAFN